MLPCNAFDSSGYYNNGMAVGAPAYASRHLSRAQTNSLSTGLGTNWVDVANSQYVTSTNLARDPAAPTVF
jgi:hypothetical protein